ncbi:hypothetical protein HDU90_008191 [Geranomyces variabilis]|nr:hypothetical protein HDU90_008191 [Geranomyces variabilis]
MRIASLLQDERPNGPTPAAAAAAAFAAAAAAAAGAPADAQQPTSSNTSADDGPESNQDPAPADLIEDPPPVLQLVLVDQHGQQILQKPEELPNWICHVSLHSAFTDEDRNVIVKPVRRPDSGTPVTTPVAPPPMAALFDDDPLGPAADRNQHPCPTLARPPVQSANPPPLALQESSQSAALLPAFGPPSLDRRRSSLRPWSAHSTSSPSADVEGQDLNSVVSGTSSYSSHRQQHQQHHLHRRGSSPQPLPPYPPHQSHRLHQQQHHPPSHQHQPHLSSSFGRSSSQFASPPAPPIKPIAGAGASAAQSSSISSSYHHHHHHHHRSLHHDYRQNALLGSPSTRSPPPLAPEQHHPHTYLPHHQRALDTSRYIQTLVGATVASCDPLIDVDGQPGMYFVYNDLSVRPQGSYRLKFLLVHLNLDLTLAEAMGTLLTDVFEVSPPKTFPGMTESTALSKCFARQGVPIHIRKDWCQPSSAGGGDAAAGEGDGEGGGDAIREVEGDVAVAGPNVSESVSVALPSRSVFFLFAKTCIYEQSCKPGWREY